MGSFWNSAVHIATPHDYLFPQLPHRCWRIWKEHCGEADEDYSRGWLLTSRTGELQGNLQPVGLSVVVINSVSSCNPDCCQLL